MRLNTLSLGFPRILGFSEFFLIEEGTGDLVKLSARLSPPPRPQKPQAASVRNIIQLWL